MRNVETVGWRVNVGMVETAGATVLRQVDVTEQTKRHRCESPCGSVHPPSRPALLPSRPGCHQSRENYARRQSMSSLGCIRFSHGDGGGARIRLRWPSSEIL